MIAHSVFNVAAILTPVIGLGLALVVVILWEMVEPRIVTLLVSSPHRALPDYRERLRVMRGRLVPRRAESPWYEKKAIVLILLFLVFAPAGLYGLFRCGSLGTHMKWVYFSIWLGLTAVATLSMGR